MIVMEFKKGEATYRYDNHANALEVWSRVEKDLRLRGVRDRAIREMDFTGCDLRGINFGGWEPPRNVDAPQMSMMVDFEGADLSNTNWYFARVNNANFYDANFNQAVLDSTIFRGCNFKYAQWRNASMQDTLFSDCNLSRSRFAGVDLKYTNWSQCNLFFARFETCGMEFVSFRDDCNLQSAYFNDCKMTGAFLSRADTRGAHIPGFIRINGPITYPIVVSDTHITIGCQHHPIDWWTNDYNIDWLYNQFVSEDTDDDYRVALHLINVALASLQSSVQLSLP